MPAGVHSYDSSFGDTRVDCDQIDESGYFHHTGTQSYAAYVDIANLANCTIETSGGVTGPVSGPDHGFGVTSRYELPQGSDKVAAIILTRASNNAVLTISRAPEPEVVEPPTPVKLEDALSNIRYLLPDRPRAVNGINVGQPGQNFRDHFFDCDAIDETATYNIAPTVSTMRADLLNYGNCTVVSSPTVSVSTIANFQRRTIATNGQVAITNTANQKTLTVIYGSVPTATAALSSRSARGVVGELLEPVQLEAINFVPGGYSVDPALPDGLNIDPTSGVISGTPTSPSQGQYAITATDGTKQGTGILNLEVSADPAYVVTFDQKMGTNPYPYAVSVTPGNSLPLPTTNSLKDDSLFGGWYTEPEGTGDFIGLGGDSFTPISSPVTLHANWVPSRDICFRQLNSTVNNAVTISPEWVNEWSQSFPARPCASPAAGTLVRVPSGQDFNLPVPTRTNAGFHGWYNAAQTADGSGPNGTLLGLGGQLNQVAFSAGSVLQYHSQWQTSTFRINFDPNMFGADLGNAPCEAVGSQCGIRWNPGDAVGADGRAAVTAPSPARDGWRFNGWYTSSSGGTRVGGAGDLISALANTTFRGQWTQLRLNRSAASITATRNEAITSWTLTAEGFTPTSFSIAPTLPVGLSIDEATGEITGTPTVVQESTTYTITGTGDDGTATTTVSIAVAAPVPGAPTNLRATPGDSQVTLAWDAPSNAPDAEISNYGYSLDGGAWSAFDPAVTASPVTITGLTNGQEYSVRLRAVNSVGEGAASDPVTATPEAPAEPPAPGPTPDPTPTPKPDGELPQVPPGLVQVVTDCPSVTVPSDTGLCDDDPVEVSVVNDDRDLMLKGSDFDLSISGECVEDCRITENSEGNQVLELERNGMARVQGSGFESGSPVYVWLFSEPKLLGTLTVSDDGSFAGSVPIGTIDVGEHTLQVSGRSGDGRTRALSLGVVVTATDRYVPLMPERIVDTRQSLGVLQPGEVFAVRVDSIPVDAEAAALNVTVANAEGDGFFTVWPCGVAMPNASNGNFVGINTIAGTVISGIGDDHSVCISVGQSAAHVLVDVMGYFPFGSNYEAFTPERMFDSRDSYGMIAADGTVRVSLGDLADDVRAAVVNVTIANATGDGFFTVWDCADEVPPTSNGNFVGISTVANKVVTATGPDDEICIRVGQVDAHVIVDLLGVLHADSHYAAMGSEQAGELADELGVGRAYQPDRVEDTREDGEPVQPGQVLEVKLEDVPVGARAVAMNVTVANAEGDGFFTVWPCGADKPGTSNGNFVGITTIANKVISGIGEDHSVCIELGQSAAAIIVDIFGYVPAPAG